VKALSKLVQTIEEWTENAEEEEEEALYHRNRSFLRTDGQMAEVK
jgi:hypothetical protein